MAVAVQTMTDEQRKSVALEYLKAFDNGGVTSTGGSILDLFAEDAQVYFPKWGVATGKAQIGKMFGAVGGRHQGDPPRLRELQLDHDRHRHVRLRGHVYGEHHDGAWRAGVTHSGRWCDVFEVRDFLIQRCFIYLDPDYAGLDTDRYPWLSADGRDASKPLG